MLAAGSGILYGSVNVAAKYVDTGPLAKAAAAYLVSGLVLSYFLRDLRVEPTDWWQVLVMGLVGGGVAPVLLFFGLREAAAVDAGVLLTLELVTTAVLAFVFLGERFSKRASAGLAALFTAAIVVALGGSREGPDTSPAGVFLVLGAAVAWGVDNAVSTHLVGNYRPQQLIAIKGLLGGLASAAAWAVVNPELPDARAAGQLVLLGLFSIAVSSLLFYYALKSVGAARTSAANIATTALVGAVGGSLFLREGFGALHLVALVLVGIGAVLIAERPYAQAGPTPAATDAGGSGAR
jgi:drug/metabolite transporter (DMT)-like permease